MVSTEKAIQNRRQLGSKHWMKWEWGGSTTSWRNSGSGYDCSIWAKTKDKAQREKAMTPPNVQLALWPILVSTHSGATSSESAGSKPNVNFPHSQTPADHSHSHWPHDQQTTVQWKHHQEAQDSNSHVTAQVRLCDRGVSELESS